MSSNLTAGPTSEVAFDGIFHPPAARSPSPPSHRGFDDVDQQPPSLLWELMDQALLPRSWHRLPEEDTLDSNLVEMDTMNTPQAHRSHDGLQAGRAATMPMEPLVPDPSGSSDSSSLAPSLDLGLVQQQALSHRGVGLVKTFIIVVKSFIGTGILMMPRAFYNGGILFAPAAMAFVGVYSLVCTVLLVRCRQKVQGPCGFSDLGKMACGPHLGWLIKVSIVLSQCGFCAGYCIFISHNLFQVLTSVGLGKSWLTEAWLVCFQVVLHIPLALIRHMKYFAAPALVAELCIFGGVLCIAVYSMFVINSPEWQASPPRLSLFNKEHFGICFGMAISAYEGIAVVLPIHDAMSRPAKFNTLLAGNTLLMLVTYTSFACIGYVAFGSGVHDVIILNLPAGSLLSAGIQFAYCVAVLFTFPLQLFPVLQVLEKGLRYGPAAINLHRCCVVLLISLLAVLSTKHLEHLQSLIGGLCCAPLAFIFPSIIHFNLAAVSMREKVLDVLYATLGVFIMVYVLYNSIADWIATAYVLHPLTP